MKPHQIPQLLFKYRVVVMAAAIVILGLTGMFSVHAHQQRLTQADTVAANQAATPHQIKQQQRHLKARLKTYLTHITADGTTSVSFYNLGPIAGSSAAKSPLARQFYRRGQLAVSANAHTPVVSASTYKLFIAAYLFHLNHQGQYTWDTTSQDGFHRMIVNSENDFAEGILDTYGLAGIDNYIGSQDYYAPMFIANQEAMTTAASLTKLLVRLDRAQAPFNHAHDRSWLLSLMKQQVYRTGIPAGASAAKAGTTVADKVGFLGDTNNDAAIVTLPSGQRYVLVIMTHGHGQTGFSGFPRMAKITTHIQKLMYGAIATQKLH